MFLMSFPQFCSSYCHLRWLPKHKGIFSDYFVSLWNVFQENGCIYWPNNPSWIYCQFFYECHWCFVTFQLSCGKEITALILLSKIIKHLSTPFKYFYLLSYFALHYLHLDVFLFNIFFFAPRQFHCLSFLSSMPKLQFAAFKL